MSHAPALSVVMSVYNAERYVAQAVESILSQTFSDFEFLIINDGSTDGSFAILAAYAAQDPRIQLVNSPRLGIPQAKNRLLAEAQGEFVAVMDADDLALPNRFALQVDFLQARPDVVAVGGDHEFIDQKGRSLGWSDLPATDAEIQRLLLGGIALIHHPCTLIRRAALSQIGGYNEEMVSSEDLDLWLRLGELGHLANLKTPVLRYRLHPNSATHSDQARQRADASAACERAWSRRGISGEFIRDYTDRLNQHQFLLDCGWLGVTTNQRDMALEYAVQAVRVRPISRSSWKLLLSALMMPMRPERL